MPGGALSRRSRQNLIATGCRRFPRWWASSIEECAGSQQRGLLPRRSSRCHLLAPRHTLRLPRAARPGAIVALSDDRPSLTSAPPRTHQLRRWHSLWENAARSHRPPDRSLPRHGAHSAARDLVCTDVPSLPRPPGAPRLPRGPRLPRLPWALRAFAMAEAAAPHAGPRRWPRAAARGHRRFLGSAGRSSRAGRHPGGPDAGCDALPTVYPPQMHAGQQGD